MNETVDGNQCPKECCRQAVAAYKQEVAMRKAASFWSHDNYWSIVPALVFGIAIPLKFINREPVVWSLSDTLTIGFMFLCLYAAVSGIRKWLSAKKRLRQTEK